MAVSHRVGTFGVSSTPYWWARFMGLMGRFVGHVMGSFTGNQKFLHLWVWLLAYEMVGKPFGYHKSI